MTDPLFAPDYAEPVNTSTQVDRMPGTADAPCHCGRETCLYPFCHPSEETEEE